MDIKINECEVLRLMKLLEFIPKQRSNPGSLIQVGTQGYTFGVEIIVEDPTAVNGKYHHSWAMPVYKDDGGEFIDFEKTRLESILGKMYLHDILN